MFIGEPLQYVNGHSTRLSPVEYLVEDRGYKTCCWVWQRGVGASGYGRKQVNGVKRQAHCLYFEEAYGAIPEGLEVDHLCRVKRCVNPEHLEAVTHVENLRRGFIAKLYEEEVVRIRAMYATGQYTQSELAKAFGVTSSSISCIVTGRSWGEA